MPRRKAGKETTGTRTNVPVPLSPKANQAVNDWCDRTGGSKAKLIELLTEWFAAAPESMQQVITNNIAHDLRSAYIERAREWFDSMLEAKAKAVTLPRELEAKVRDYAAREDRDPLDWLEFAINDAAPTPVTPEPGVVRRRSGSRRLPQGGGQPSNVGAGAR